MPFADYEDFAACVRANQDKSDPEAYCAAIKREVEGEESLSDDEREHLKRLSAADPETNTRIHETRALEAGGTVQRKENDDGSVRYTNICLLAPGEWTDAASRTTIYYAPDAIKRSAQNWMDNQVNLYHQPGDPIANVGHIDTDTVDVDADGALYGDVVLHGRTQASQDAIGLMDLALETDGDQGIGGPSVEIPDDVTEWDDTRGMERMKEMSFSGAALVMHPASREVSFDQQFEERAVAMAEGGEQRSIALMTREETTKPEGTEQGGMGQNEPDDPLKALASVRNRLRELQEELQNPSDELIAAIEAYNSAEGNAPEDDVDEFIEWAEDADVPEEAVELARSADVESVDELQSWATSATTSEAESEGEETPDDGEEMQEEGEGEGEATESPNPGPGSPEGDGGTLPDETARAVVSALEDVAETVDAVQDAVEQEIESAEVEMEEYRDELTEELAEVKERVAELEDGGDAKSLADGTEDVTEDEEMLDAAADTPTSDGKGYITR